jgi:hypothetical protein
MTELTNKQLLTDIIKYVPGDLGDIAMMVPCHVQTLYNINMEKGTPRPVIVSKLKELHVKAMEIKAVADA